MAANRPLVVLDTDVWSGLYGRNRRDHPRTAEWRATLTGLTVVISTQTRAEVLTGLAIRDLGAARSEAITAQLDRTLTVPVTEDVVRAFAELTAACRRLALGLQDKKHTGDRWVAATAIAIGAPLLAVDKIYGNAPGVRLLGNEAPLATAQTEDEEDLTHG